MKFRNRVVNPVVRLLLGSPLHRLFSSSLVILAYQGRKTGRWHRLPCMYARDGQDLYIVAAQPDRKVWWRNLRQPARVRLRPVRCRVPGRADDAKANYRLDRLNQVLRTWWQTAWARRSSRRDQVIETGTRILREAPVETLPGWMAR